MIRIILTDIGISILHRGSEILFISEDPNREVMLMTPSGSELQLIDGISPSFEAPDVEVRDMRKTNAEDRRAPRPRTRHVTQMTRGKNVGSSPGTSEEQKRVAQDDDVRKILSLIEKSESAHPDQNPTERRRETHRIAQEVFNSTEQKHIMSVAGVRAARSRGVYRHDE